ncbi:MAG: hypothetical protein HYV65_03550 [Candidatus Spechtbacteria bacterium]|nr:hypothetical protein [Candidatus Spechtbacteria bacterium]
MDWYAILVVGHIIGVVLGVGGETFAEIFHLRAMRDGQIDAVEGDFLKTTYRILRAGLLLLVLSGFGFLLYYRLTGQSELIYQAHFLAKLTIVGILLANAVMMQARKMPLWLGSAISLTSWYGALIIGAWGSGIGTSYFTIMGMYIIAIGAVAVAMSFVREFLGVKLP